jgi:type I restriction enzyme S subunit
LLVEDLEVCQLYAKTANSKRLEEIHQGYTYFQENDLLLPKIRPSFDNGKMSIAKSLVNGIGFGSTEFIVLRAKEEIMID